MPLKLTFDWPRCNQLHNHIRPHLALNTNSPVPKTLREKPI
jgi:hypothetical protein